MKAAVLAAGYGTRLKPLTDICPKPLMPILNRPLLGIVLAQLESAGCLQVAVNTHHLAGQVQDYLRSEPWSFHLSVSHEQEILGTGGGIKQLGEILRDGPFLAINGDILTDLDLGEIYRNHQEDAITTLVLHDCPLYNNVCVADGAVVSIGAPPPGTATSLLAYTGIQVVDPKMLPYLPAAGQPYNLVQAWREALAAGERLAYLTVTSHFWQDIGTPKNYLAAHRRLLQGESKGLRRFFPALTDPLIGPGAKIGAEVKFGGRVCLGGDVTVGEGASLKNSVVWDHVVIASEIELKGCIVANRVKVEASAQNKIIVR